MQGFVLSLFIYITQKKHTYIQKNDILLVYLLSIIEEKRERERGTGVVGGLSGSVYNIYLFILGSYTFGIKIRNLSSIM